MTKHERRELWNDNFRKWNGFNQNYDTWVILGDTFEIKDELKQKGAKYSREMGWCFDHEQTDYPTVKVHASQVAEENFEGRWLFKDNVYEFIRELQKANTHYEETGKFLGQVGDTMQFWDLICVKVYQYPSVYGDVNVYTFKDPEDNTIVWSTSKYLEDIDDPDARFYLTGKIKDHKEWKGDKQTIVTRCKVEVYK